MNIEDIRRKMNSIKGESWDVRINCLFWIERLFLFLAFVFPTQVFDLIVPLILSTTLLALPFLFFNPNLSSVGPSGIGGFWLFLLDRSMFYLCLEYSQLLAAGFDLTFLWRLTVSLSLVIHSIYIADHLLRSHQPLLPTPISTGDVSKVKELVEDGKKMMTSMEHMIHSALETLRKELGEFRDDWKKEMMTQVDFVREDMRLSVDEICAGLLDDLRSKVAEDIIALGQDCIKNVKAVADQLDETYLSIQETAKEVKTRADETHQEGQNKRRMIRGEDVEGFVELREQVRRMSVEAEIAAEELSRATVELVDARMQQWDEDNADYLASLPLLYFNQII